MLAGACCCGKASFGPAPEARSAPAAWAEAAPGFPVRPIGLSEETAVPEASAARPCVVLPALLIYLRMPALGNRVLSERLASGFTFGGGVCISGGMSR